MRGTRPIRSAPLAADQVLAMRSLCFDRFFLAAHDRGARVAHRLTLDHPDAVERLALLDIAPTLDMYEGTDLGFAISYYHWFLLIQPGGLPERLLGAEPEFFLRHKLGSTGGGGTDPAIFTAAAMAEYIRCFSDPATIHATCEEYRAGASIDLEHDRATLDEKMKAPLLVLWGARGTIERCFDPLTLWRARASAVQGEALPCGHYLAEELPVETAARLERFFTA